MEPVTGLGFFQTNRGTKAHRDAVDHDPVSAFGGAQFGGKGFLCGQWLARHKSQAVQQPSRREYSSMIRHVPCVPALLGR